MPAGAFALRKETVMADIKRFEQEPTRESSDTIESGLHNSDNNKPSKHGGVPPETFPPFNDPAFSSARAEPPPTDPHAMPDPAPEDPIYAGHPEFSQDAGKNKLPPDGVGNSEPLSDANEKTRHSDGQRPLRPTPTH